MIRLLAPVLLTAAALPSNSSTVLVAFESGIEPYAEAVEGLSAVVGPRNVQLCDVRQGDADLPAALKARDLKVVVTVGSRAAAAVAAYHTSLPVIETMVLHDASHDAGGRVELEIPPLAQLEAIRSLFPGRSRVGVIRNRTRSHYSAAELEAEARRLGFSAIVFDCDGPANLLNAVAQSRGQVDFLLCFPDPELYNPVTIKRFMMASFEARVPVLGFSPAFVRAGAAAGIYPDYRDIGRQTGEMVLRRLRGEDCGTETPRKTRIAVNERVARLIGVGFRLNTPGIEVFR
jgi:putative ABC transport system substrate-binding protein